MFEKAKKLFIIPMIAFVSMASLVFISPVAVHAQETEVGQSALCKIFPFINSIGIFGVNAALCGTGTTEDTANKVAVTTLSTIQLIVSFIFIAIIAISIFIIIKAAIKYIRSEGDESKVQEAQKAIKTVFIGVAALFVGILGIVLVLAFFQVSNIGGTTGLDTSNLPQFLQVFLNGLSGQ